MNESNLIKSYINNNKLNIEKVMENYTPYIYTIIKNKSSELTEEDVEEIISDVFLALWKNQEKLDINKDLSSYLAGITKNLYNKKIRYRKSNMNIDDYQNSLFEVESTELKVEKAEKENMIIMIVNNMEQEDKDIFVLYYYNSKSMKEIAKILNIKENKIKSRLCRIRKKIKKILEKRGYSYNG